MLLYLWRQNLHFEDAKLSTDWAEHTTDIYIIITSIDTVLQFYNQLVSVGLHPNNCFGDYIIKIIVDHWQLLHFYNLHIYRKYKFWQICIIYNSWFLIITADCKTFSKRESVTKASIDFFLLWKLVMIVRDYPGCGQGGQSSGTGGLEWDRTLCPRKNSKLLKEPVAEFAQLFSHMIWGHPLC